MESHNHAPDPGTGLGFGFLINTVFVIIEFTAGILSNSLALISDSIHNLTDSFSILLSYLANHIGKKAADPSKTFGYGRATILAAAINATILLVTSGFIFYVAYQRLMHPEPVSGGIVAIIAAIGILSNGTVAFVVSRNKHDLNSRAIFVSNLMDTLSSLGALIAGIVILVTHQTWADPLISLLIATLLLRAAWEIIREASSVLLEGVPNGIDALKVKESILAIEHIRDLDDLHVWTMGAGEAALSCHVVIDDCSVKEGVRIVSALKRMLSEKYMITHSTIETQTESGPHDDERSNEGLSALHN